MWTNKQRITETEIASKITADRQLVKQTSCALLSLAATASAGLSLSAPSPRSWSGPLAALICFTCSKQSFHCGLVWFGGHSIDASLLALLFYSCLVLAFDAVMWKEM